MKLALPVLLGLLAAPLRAEPASAEPALPPGDFSLAQCLQIAIDHNPQLRIASEQFLAARGQGLKLHAILYPSVNAQGLTAPATLYVQINQVLYSRATFPQLRISRLAQDQAVINYQQTLNDVAFQVRQAFFSALGARKAFELIQSFAAGQGRAAADAQQLFDAGKIQKNEVLGVQVIHDLLAQSQEAAQLRATQALLALDNLLGENLPDEARLAGDLDPPVPTPLDPAVLTEEALRDRPDLKLLESLRLSQRQQILVDQKNAFPVVGFSSNSAFQPPALGSINNFDLERNYDEPEIQRQEGNSQLPLSLYVNWLIFDGGNLAGLRASDQAQLETQEVAIAELKRSIPSEITAAVNAIQNEQATLRTLGAEMPPDELRKSAQLDYQARRIRQLDLQPFRVGRFAGPARTASSRLENPAQARRGRP